MMLYFVKYKIYLELIKYVINKREFLNYNCTIYTEITAKLKNLLF